MVYAFGHGAEFEGLLLGALERIESGGALRVLDVLFVMREPDSGELAALDLQGRTTGGLVAPLRRLPARARANGAGPHGARSATGRTTRGPQPCARWARRWRRERRSRRRSSSTCGPARWRMPSRGSVAGAWPAGSSPGGRSPSVAPELLAAARGEQADEPRPAGSGPGRRFREQPPAGRYYVLLGPCVRRSPRRASPVAEVVVQVGELDGARELARRAVGARDPQDVLLVGLGVSAGQELQGSELDLGEALPDELRGSDGRVLEDVVQEGDRARLRRHGGGHPLDMVDERGARPVAHAEEAVVGDATRRRSLHAYSIAPRRSPRIPHIG